MELLLGCGNTRKKQIVWPGQPQEWTSLVTLDIDPHAGADVLHDLNDLPLPFAEDTFDEIHAYEVLEHFGRQGDWKAFLAFFQEAWRVAKPGALFCASVPMWNSEWAWGDPGHTRVITRGSLVFLSQAEYERQVGVTPMTDYRALYSADWEILDTAELNDAGRLFFILKAIKQAR